MRLGDAILDAGLITKYQLKYALAMHKETKFRLGRQLTELDYITKNELGDFLSEEYGVEYFDLMSIKEIPKEIVSKMPFDKADEYKVVPFGVNEDGKLKVAISDPSDINILDDIAFVLEEMPEIYLSDEMDIQATITKYYGDQLANLKIMIDEFGMEIEALEEEGALDEDIAKAADSKPVVRFLQLVLKRGVTDQASDLHFEPYEDAFRVRYRVDGVLYEIESPPKQLAAAIIARIKIVSNLNIGETRLPQDGRIETKIDGRPVDLRVSIVPTKFGESAVLRILDKSVVSLDLNNLRLSNQEVVMFQRIISRPSGIILVTGPTGSGKTTTLYACLNEVNKEDVKIITNEDPVEYNIDGLIQVPINASQGLSFAASLRATLRQDPDIILVGEIRDYETAEIAIESALTGHLVFSTLHTNDAPSSVTRLADLGIKNFLIAATLEAIIAQRLVRTICIDCKVPYTPRDEDLHKLNIDPKTLDSKITFYQGEGCDNCRNTSYRGRIALYEILEIDQTIRELVLQDASVQEMQEAALASGMKSLREVGIQKIFDGLTTIEEVVQATVTAD
jgi:type IV pilus assembly protein PilB